MSHNGAGTDATTAATATNTSQGGGGGSAAPAPSPPTPIVAVPTIAAAAAAANTADHDMDNDDGDSLPPPQFPMPGGPQRVVTFATEVSPSPGGGSSNSSSSSSRAGVSSSTAPGLAAGRRRKIAAAPGRSQLDWVRLKASGGARPNAGSGPQQLRRYTPAEVAAHGRRGDCWMALAGRVYDVTAYVEYHPGGAGQLLRGAGRDATRLFMQVHPWVNYEFLLGDACLVGFLLPDPAAAPAALSPFSA
ncbi:Cytochrome b5 reductase 4, partial [Cladochytrium tenue]